MIWVHRMRVTRSKLNQKLNKLDFVYWFFSCNSIFWILMWRTQFEYGVRIAAAIFTSKSIEKSRMKMSFSIYDGESTFVYILVLLFWFRIEQLYSVVWTCFICVYVFFSFIFFCAGHSSFKFDWFISIFNRLKIIFHFTFFFVSFDHISFSCFLLKF